MKRTKKYVCSSSSNNQQFEYMLLDRLRTDCNYFLKYPYEKHLWAGSVEGQISKMKELWNSLQVKPEGLSMEDIEQYRIDMEKALTDRDIRNSSTKVYSPAVYAADSPYQVKALIKEIHDSIYNLSSKYLKAEGWDMTDIADYFVTEVQEVEPGVIRAEIRGELDYEQLSELCSQLDKVIAVKFDKDAYFEPVEPGIAEAFIRTNVDACSNVTASSTNTPTMQDVQALIDDYGTKYFEAIPTSGGRELWFSVFDVGNYNIRIEDGKIIMISTDDPYDDVRIFHSLEELRSYLEKQIAIGKQEADMNYSANASTLVTSSLNYVTPEMKQLKRALSKIYVDNDDQFHELVDSLLSNEPINLVPETRALKRAIDNMVVDSEEEKRALIYEVAKDLGVIESSSAIKAYTFDESEDGWGEDVESILSPVFARAEDLMYEVRNTVRGANTDCETTEDLADFIRQLASEFEDAANEIESL